VAQSRHIKSRHSRRILRSWAFHFKRLDYLIQDAFHDPEKSDGLRPETVYLFYDDTRPKEEGRGIADVRVETINDDITV
jgi:hypothetical protein